MILRSKLYKKVYWIALLKCLLTFTMLVIVVAGAVLLVLWFLKEYATGSSKPKGLGSTIFFVLIWILSLLPPVFMGLVVGVLTFCFSAPKILGWLNLPKKFEIENGGMLVRPLFSLSRGGDYYALDDLAYTTYDKEIMKGVSVPVFQLVYRDSVLLDIGQDQYINHEELVNALKIKKWEAPETD